MNNSFFRNKTAVVTGAGGTLCCAVAIRVKTVAPGFFANERSRKILMTEDGGLTSRGQNVMAHTPMKRLGEAQDLLGAVCWLPDDVRAGFVTGVTIAVDGGFSASSGV